MQRGPVLDGLPEWYLADQLKKFKSGQRGKNAANRAEALMGVAMAKVETEVQLAGLARHFAEAQTEAVHPRGSRQHPRRQGTLRDTMRVVPWREG